MSSTTFNVTVPLDGTLVLPPEFAGQEVRVVVKTIPPNKVSEQTDRAKRFAGSLKLTEQQYKDFSESIEQSRNE
ncbi:MAG: hypothetical protein LBG58_08010 [Planctomycetaceae bacterium]|jgi:hypothetical protein|nr:hypothetical protein [Planctomycetaceae bacterium]